MKNDQIDRGIKHLFGLADKYPKCKITAADLLDILTAMREPEQTFMGHKVKVDLNCPPKCWYFMKEPEKKYCDCGEELIDGRCPLEPEREIKRKEPEEKTPNKSSNVIITKKEYEFLKASEKNEEFYKHHYYGLIYERQQKGAPIREVYKKWKSNLPNLYEGSFDLSDMSRQMWNAIKKYCEEDK